jgi:hypothetical protein
MSLDSSIRAMRAQVRRLGDAAGKGQRNCISCRLQAARGDVYTREPGLPPEDVVKAKCNHCGSELWFKLKEYTHVSREVVRLFFSTPTENYFTDSKAYALYLWVDPERERLKGAEGKRGAAAPLRWHGRATKLAEWTAQYDELERRMFRRLVAKYGEDPFPELTRRVESILGEAHERHDASLLAKGHPDREEFDDLERCERHRLVAAEMERLIFGRVMPETEESVEAIRGKIDGLLERSRGERRWQQEQESRRREEKGRRLEAESRRRADEESHRLAEEEARRLEEEEKEKMARILRDFLPPDC